MNQDNNKKEESCPLCNISKEAIEKINSESGVVNTQKSKVSLKGLIILGLTGVVVFSIYMLKPSFFSQASQNDESAEINTSHSRGERSKQQINPQAPNFITEDIFGNKVSLSDYRGKKPVLLVFWATWCVYCRKEKDDLEMFTKRYQDKIQVLAIDSGEPKQIVKNYVEKENIKFLVLLDENRKIWNQYSVRGTPTHFLISKDGEIITIWIGLASLADLEKMLSMIPVR